MPTAVSLEKQRGPSSAIDKPLRRAIDAMVRELEDH